MTEFAFGILDKEVKNHSYSYFWRYDGAGNRTETYLGRAGKPRTQKRGLEVKLQYLQALGQEIQKLIAETILDLEQLPTEAPKKGTGQT